MLSSQHRNTNGKQAPLMQACQRFCFRCWSRADPPHPGDRSLISDRTNPLSDMNTESLWLLRFKAAIVVKVEVYYGYQKKIIDCGHS